MELSEEVLNGLEIVGNSLKVPDKLFPGLIEVISNSLLDTHSDAFNNFSTTTTLDPAVAKLSVFAVSSLLLEASKHDADTTALSHILEECKFLPDRISQITTVYEKSKPLIRSMLSQIGTTPPHIVDVSWRLDYSMKSNVISRGSQPVYLINLKTQQADDSKDIQLSCSLDQLQDLVGKLRDACKSLERTAQL